MRKFEFVSRTLDRIEASFPLGPAVAVACLCVWAIGSICLEVGRFLLNHISTLTFTEALALSILAGISAGAIRAYIVVPKVAKKPLHPEVRELCVVLTGLTYIALLILSFVGLASVPVILLMPLIAASAIWQLTKWKYKDRPNDASRLLDLIFAR